MYPPVKQRTVSIVFFTIIFVTIWNCDSVFSARLPVYDNALRDKPFFTNSEWLKSHQRQRSLLSSSKFDRRLSASSRQGGIPAALMAGPAIMAASSLLLSLPVLPLLFLTPLVSNLIPSLEEITEEIQSNPQLGEILQGVQILGQGFLQNTRPGQFITQALTGAKPAAAAAAAAASSGASSSSSSSSSFSSLSSSLLSNGSSPNKEPAGSQASASNNIISVAAPPPSITASIVPASSSSSSGSSSPQKISTGSGVTSQTDPLGDLSGGFISQLAAINDILSNNIGSSTDDPFSSLQNLVATTLASLSKFFFSSKREEQGWRNRLAGLNLRRWRKSNLKRMSTIPKQSSIPLAQQHFPQQIGFRNYYQDLYTRLHSYPKSFEARL